MCTTVAPHYSTSTVYICSWALPIPAIIGTNITRLAMLATFMGSAHTRHNQWELRRARTLHTRHACPPARSASAFAPAGLAVLVAPRVSFGYRVRRAVVCAEDVRIVKKTSRMGARPSVDSTLFHQPSPAHPSCLSSARCYLCVRVVSYQRGEVLPLCARKSRRPP